MTPLFPRPRDRIALDRASARRFDHDGHLHVADNVLSAAVVSPYYGEEIPDWERLSLQPGRTYRLLRDPKELARAASSFDGKPLLVRHRPVTADDHAHEIVAGSVSNVTFDGATGRLRGDISIWDGDAIRAIQNGSSAALSCGYAYSADMTPGTYRGEAYDGVMRDIRANHVSLVPEGRVPFALVGDASLKSRRLPMAEDTDDTRMKLLNFLAGKLDGDALLQAIKIIDGTDDGDVDEEASGQAADAKMKKLAADKARRSAMFPNAGRLR